MTSAEPATEPATQSFYQVRFDWGLAGAAAIDPGSHAIIWVDQIGEQQKQLPATDVVIIAGSLQNAAAVADWVIAQQTLRGDRFRIAVVAAGEPRADGSLRFAVEDLLAAGAIVEALTAVGIDHSSPEAAAAGAAYLGLRNASRHLIGASVSARELENYKLDPTPVAEVVVLKDFAAS